MAASASAKDDERQKLVEGEEIPAKKDDKKDGTRLVTGATARAWGRRVFFFAFPF